MAVEDNATRTRASAFGAKAAAVTVELLAAAVVAKTTPSSRMGGVGGMRCCCQLGMPVAVEGEEKERAAAMIPLTAMAATVMPMLLFTEATMKTLPAVPVAV